MASADDLEDPEQFTDECEMRRLAPLRLACELVCPSHLSLYIYVYIYIYVVIFVLHSVGLATRGFLNFAFPKKSLTMHNIGVRINIALIFVCSPFRLCQLYLNGQLLSIQEAKEQ